MSRVALPRLYANAADVATQKILVAAKAAGLDLKLEAAKGGVPELHKGDKVVKYTNAILRYVGKVFENSEIYGSSFAEAGQVDSWLDWTEFEFGNASPPGLAKAVEKLEKHLDERVFLVGQRYTIADASLSCSIYNFQQQGLTPSLPKATKRWLGACTAKDAFQSVFKGASTGSASTMQKPGAAASSGSSDVIGKLKPVEKSLVASYSSAVGGRTRVAQILSSPDKGESLVGQVLSVCGWVRTKREAAKGKVVFVSINDGSCVGSIQVVIDAGTKGFEDLKIVNTGASMRCTGEVVKSQGKGQSVELAIRGDGHESKVFGGVALTLRHWGL
jgi:glutathione S-transferase